MFNLILWIAVIYMPTFSKAAAVISTENIPEHIPAPEPKVHLNPEPEKAKSEELRLSLKSVDIARNLWRDDEKGELFRVFREPHIMTAEDGKDGIPCAHHAHDRSDENLPESPNELAAAQFVPQNIPKFGKTNPSKRAGRTFWPFVSWHYNDCYYYGIGCYPPPPPYYPEYPPPPYY